MTPNYVTKGSPISVPTAAFHNAVVDAAIANRNNHKQTERPRQLDARDSGIVYIQNTTGETIEMFTAVVIDVPTVTTEIREDLFKSQMLMKVIKPTAESEGIWMVTQQQIVQNGIGLAIVIGVTQCKVNLNSTSDTFVEVEENNVIPVGSGSGSAQILWVAGGVGSATATGEQYAIIKLGGGASGDSCCQYPGMSHITTGNNVCAGAYPFAINPVI